MLVAVCNLPQQTEVGLARFKIRLLNPYHLLQSYVVWVECSAMYADKRLTAQMASLTAIRHLRCANVIRVLGDATCVQGHVSTVERFVQDLNLL